MVDVFLYKNEHRIFKPFEITIGRETKWFMPAILATQEAEIRKITIQSQPGKIVH
jgi:hypothetical protein